MVKRPDPILKNDESLFLEAAIRSRMGEKFRRSLFFNINKHQAATILPVMIVLVFLLLLCGFSYYWIIYLDPALQGTRELFFLEKIIPGLFILFLLFVLLYVYWVFFITNRLLGPFERVVKELDEMIENKKEWRHLNTREGDQMFEQLIRRINILIDRI
jgi:hypothetical protein